MLRGVTTKAERLVVDGIEFFWRQRHGWLVERDRGLKGVSVSVWHISDRTRELIIDFPFNVFGLEKRPGRAKLLAVIEPAIRDAILAGWDPESRGKAFRFVAEERS